MTGSIPAQLLAYQQWLIWRLEERDNKPTKVPYQAAFPNRRASSTDPRTWSSFETAVAAAEHASGVGFVFSTSDPFVGIDLDHCVDPQTGELHPAAVEIIDRLGSYWEWSPSRTGVHVIVEGELPGDRHKTEATGWAGAFECYSAGRFFTMTGDGQGELCRARAELDALIEQMFSPEAQNGSGPSGASERAAGDESARSREELLDEFPELKRIAGHEGKAPKDTSDSGWDFYLACESTRSGLTDPEIEILIRHARRGDSKATRADYITRTISGARKTAGADDPAGRISKRWGLEKDPIVSGEIVKGWWCC